MAAPLADAADTARFVRLLAALHDRELRARRAAVLLAALAPTDAISLLASLVDHARGRSPPAASALEGALRGCHLHLDAVTLASFCTAAEAAEQLELVALLRDCAAARTIDGEREGFIDREMRARTLGERKQLARSRDRDLFARLASDPDPSVLRALLGPTPRANPWSTPVPKAYLCSSATPPGGGVHGMSGYYAARTVLKREFGLPVPSLLPS